MRCRSNSFVMITANRVLQCQADTPEEMHHWITLLQRCKGDTRVHGQEFIIRGTGTHMHTHLHAHKHTHACKHTHTHTHNVYTNTHTHAHTPTHSCPHTHTHTSMHTHAQMPSHTRPACICVCVFSIAVYISMHSLACYNHT